MSDVIIRATAALRTNTYFKTQLNPKEIKTHRNLYLVDFTYNQIDPLAVLYYEYNMHEGKPLDTAAHQKWLVLGATTFVEIDRTYEIYPITNYAERPLWYTKVSLENTLMQMGVTIPSHIPNNLELILSNLDSHVIEWTTDTNTYTAVAQYIRQSLLSAPILTFSITPKTT